MAAPQIAPLPQFFELTGGMQIRVTAVDATTNATVAGVSITTAYADVQYVDTSDVSPAELTPVDGPYAFGDLAA